MDRPTDELVQRILAAAAARADDRAADLIAAAAAEAEAEVKSLVKSALKAALLQRAAVALGSDAPPSPVPRVEPVAGDARATDGDEDTNDTAVTAPAPDTGCYVYCITRADAALPPRSGRGVDPEFPIRSVVRDGLQAIVSSVTVDAFTNAALGSGDRDLGWIEQRVRAHNDVIKQALGGGPVMPLRFGTVLRDEADVREFLARHRAALTLALEELDGKTEWGLKIRARPGAVADAIEDEGPERAEQPQSSGRNYLLGKQRAARVDGAVRRTVRAWAQACYDRLASTAADAALLPPPRAAVPTSNGGGGNDERPVLNAAYLVADADRDAFHAAVDALAREYEPKGLVFQLTGPWPAYNFARLDLAAEAST